MLSISAKYPNVGVQMLENLSCWDIVRYLPTLFLANRASKYPCAHFCSTLKNGGYCEVGHRMYG